MKTKVINVDFRKTDGIYDKIEKEIQGMEIGICVNNVGVINKNPHYFLEEEISQKFISNTINVNIIAMINITKTVLLQMVDRQKGLIINISSITAVIPIIQTTIYAATKAFVDKFSNDLRSEYGCRGVTIQTVLPGSVNTQMLNLKRSNWLVPDPNTFVESALKTVGVSERTTGYYPHALLLLMFRFLKYLIPDYFKSAYVYIWRFLRYCEAKYKN